MHGASCGRKFFVFFQPSQEQAGSRHEPSQTIQQQSRQRTSEVDQRRAELLLRLPRFYPRSPPRPQSGKIVLLRLTHSYFLLRVLLVARHRRQAVCGISATSLIRASLVNTWYYGILVVSGAREFETRHNPGAPHQGRWSRSHVCCQPAAWVRGRIRSCELLSRQISILGKPDDRRGMFLFGGLPHPAPPYVTRTKSTHAHTTT